MEKSVNRSGALEQLRTLDLGSRKGGLDNQVRRVVQRQRAAVASSGEKTGNKVMLWWAWEGPRP